MGNRINKVKACVGLSDQTQTGIDSQKEVIIQKIREIFGTLADTAKKFSKEGNLDQVSDLLKKFESAKAEISLELQKLQKEIQSQAREVEQTLQNLAANLREKPDDMSAKLDDMEEKLDDMEEKLDDMEEKPDNTLNTDSPIPPVSGKRSNPPRYNAGGVCEPTHSVPTIPCYGPDYPPVSGGYNVDNLLNNSHPALVFARKHGVNKKLEETILGLISSSHLGNVINIGGISRATCLLPGYKMCKATKEDFEQSFKWLFRQELPAIRKNRSGDLEYPRDRRIAVIPLLLGWEKEGRLGQDGKWHGVGKSGFYDLGDGRVLKFDDSGGTVREKRAADGSPDGLYVIK